MKNKAYFVKRLCELRGIDSNSDEAQGFFNLKVVDLLIEIKKSIPSVPQEEEEEELSLAQRLGCS
jgi:hypothetical protein